MTLESQEPRPDGGRRLRFRIALGVYLTWVAALGVLAVVSGRRPPGHPVPAATRPAR